MSTASHIELPTTHARVNSHSSAQHIAFHIADPDEDSSNANASGASSFFQQGSQTNIASAMNSPVEGGRSAAVVPLKSDSSSSAAADDATTPLNSSSSTSDSTADDDEEEIVCRVKKYKWSPPAGFENHVYRQHQGEGSQYLRDFILGVNDGIISTFLVVVGLVAGGANVTTVLLSAISAAVAGAISMGLGEYIATKSQANVNLGEFALEKEHFTYHRDVELEQLRGFLRDVGLEGNLLEAVVSQVGKNDEHLMKIMMAFEFAASGDTADRNPLFAMWTSGRLFLMGALPSVIPFFFVKDPFMGLWISGIAVAIVLFGVGAYKSRTTMGNPWLEGGENFMFGVIGTGISFAVGIIFAKASGNEDVAY